MFAGTRLKVLDISENRRDKGSRFLAPTTSRDIYFPGTSHSIFVEKSLYSISCFAATIKLDQLLQEAVVFYVLQILNYLQIRANHVRDIQERQTHLRSNIVGYRLG